MDNLMERIFEMMEGIENDPDCLWKSWILGQIAGNITTGSSIWNLKAFSNETIKLIDSILDELQVSWTVFEYDGENVTIYTV